MDFDGKMENLALMRLSTYHKQRGDSIALKFGAHPPELWDIPDQVYVSCLFRWNLGSATEYIEGWGNRVVAGGTGIDIHSTLSDEISVCCPDYSLYGRNRAVGFISRGCIRKCPWCVVWRKEGKLKRVSTAAEIANDFPSVVFLDNNFLALADHMDDLLYLRTSGIAVDFNQGLDARLVDDRNAKELAGLNWTSCLRLALDSLSQKQSVENAVRLLKAYGLSPSKVMVYCLVGFDGVESDVERLLFLHSLGVNAFSMGFKDLETGNEPMTGWSHRLYKKYRRLICRLPQAKSVWEDFRREVALYDETPCSQSSYPLHLPRRCSGAGESSGSNP